MSTKKHLYIFGYEVFEDELCKLESNAIFNQKEKDKLLISDIKVEPSSSAFIKKRIDISSASEDYTTLIKKVKKENIQMEGFKVEYFVFEGDSTEYPNRLEKLKDIGYCIEGNPDYHSPTVMYALCCYKGVWCFGKTIKNNFNWNKHKQKPWSYSNSIGMNIAKALVNIAAQGSKEKMLLDACCGVGTILLEACFAGNKIEGCDINWKVCNKSRKNLAHFNYSATVYCTDIKDINRKYDAAIIDLPYNLLSRATEQDVAHIIESTAQITNRLVIVSTTDITTQIQNTGFNISDNCSVRKRGKTNFERRIWVCEKNKSDKHIR